MYAELVTLSKPVILCLPTHAAKGRPPNTEEHDDLTFTFKINFF